MIILEHRLGPRGQVAGLNDSLLYLPCVILGKLLNFSVPLSPQFLRDFIYSYERQSANGGGSRR